MAVTYYALLTTIGAGKLANATALGTTLKITQLAVGDGGGNVPTPDASRTQLVNEVRRAPLNRLSVDPANSSQIIAEQVIPEDVGGWWIREMGLYDEAGALIAYANCAPSYKPQLAEGSGRTQTVRIVLIVSNAASVELKIDPSVVLATREYVDSAIVSAMNRLDYKQSVRAATTASVTLSGLQTVDGVALAAGDRVLVKNQTNAVDNGLYVIAAGAWKRATDADENSEVTPGLTVTVESGTAQADSVWQLVTDGVIVLGTTALTFQNITNGLAKLASPAFSGTPTAPTTAVTSSDNSIATTAFTGNLLRSLGLGGSSKQNGVANMNSATLGATESYNGLESDAVPNNWPVLGVAAGSPVHYNVVTFGFNTRVTQLAVQVYQGGNENRTFYRSKHDSTWSAWNEMAAVNSPKLTGLPTAPTATAGNNTQQVATTAFVQSAISPLAPLTSPVFSGKPTAPTVSQFDSSNSLASTAFVKASGFQFSEWLSFLSAGTVIPPSACGKAIQVILATSGNLTLPNAASVSNGSALYFINTSSNTTATLQRAGSDSIAMPRIATSMALAPGDDLVLISNGVNSWFAVSGTARMGAANAFSAGLSANGYQKLPSGLMLQWGLVTTGTNGVGSLLFPTAFPTACCSIQLTGWTAGASAAGAASLGTFSNSGATVYGMMISPTSGTAPIALTMHWLAVGF